MSDCPHCGGEGFIIVGDAAAPCKPCLRARSDFSSRYRPAGQSRRARWRALGQKGGIASGRRRRQLARGRRPARRRTRQEALGLTYRARQLSRPEFERLYLKTWPTGNQGGLSTLWEHYVGMFTRYRKEGQHYRTTNAQRAAALSSRGRPRCERTVRRLNRRLEEMGLAVVSHYKDQRATPGHKDCLVVEMRSRTSKNVRPPAEAGRGNPLSGGGSLSPVRERRTHCQPDSSPPPSAADGDGAASPPASRREELEQAIGFAELKLRMGWGSPVLRADLAHYRAELRAMDADGSPCAGPRGSDG